MQIVDIKFTRRPLFSTVLLFYLVWILCWSCNLPEIQDHDEAGDDSAQQVDDRHGGAESDEVGGRAGPEQAAGQQVKSSQRRKLSRVHFPDGDDLEDDADGVDQKSNNDGFRVLGLDETPEEAGNKHEIDEEISLVGNISEYHQVVELEVVSPLWAMIRGRRRYREGGEPTLTCTFFSQC